MARPSTDGTARPALDGAGRPALPGVDEHPSDGDELITGEAVGLDLRPAGFVLRATGAVIDWLVYLGGFLGFMLLLSLATAVVSIDEAMGAAISIAALAFCLVVAPTAVELVSRGRSIGKLVVGVRVVRDDGGAIGFRHALIRSLTGVLEIYLSFGGFAALAGLLNGRAKRLGDLMAGTYGQYERVSRATPPVFGVPVTLQDWSLTADVARMPDGLGRRVAAFLEQAPRLTPVSRERLAVQLAAEAARYVSPLPEAPAELFLAAVAAVRRDREARALSLERARLDALGPVLSGSPHGFPER